VGILIGSIIGGLIQAAGTLVGRVLLSLGLGYAAYTGIDASITWARDFAIAKLGAMPALSIQIAGVLQVGTCVSIITSALAARMVLKGMTSGTVKAFKLS
jgi:hypothetical protein